MNIVRTVVTSLLAVLVCSTLTWAQDATTKETKKAARAEKAQTKPAAKAAKPEAKTPTTSRAGDGYRLAVTQQRLTFAEAIRQLELTAEQQKQVEQILATDKQAEESFKKENEAEMRAIRQGRQAANESKDQAAKQALDARAKVIEGKLAALQEGVRKQLATVLTREQMVKLERMMTPAGAFDRLVADIGKLQLTADQKTQIAAIVKATEVEAATQAEPAARTKVYGAAAKKVVVLLTEEQTAQLKQIRAVKPERPARNSSETKPSAAAK